MKDLLMLPLQIIGAVCALEFVGWTLNRFFGFSMGSKAGVVIPTEWEAVVSFLVAAAVCFGIVHFFGGMKKDASDGQQIKKGSIEISATLL